MGNNIRAIDMMYYVATPEFIAKWNDAKKNELICRMVAPAAACRNRTASGDDRRWTRPAWKKFFSNHARCGSIEPLDDMNTTIENRA